MVVQCGERRRSFFHAVPCLLLLVGCLALFPGVTAEVLSVVSGSVGAGNYSYHIVNTARLGRQHGSLALALRSVSGDADLYISVGRSKEPTFNNYEFCEVTCGLDILKLPETASHGNGYKGRSDDEYFSVGVYGHPRWDNSRFQLALLTNFDGDISSIETYLDGVSDYSSSDTSEQRADSVLWSVLEFLFRLAIEIIL